MEAVLAVVPAPTDEAAAQRSEAEYLAEASQAEAAQNLPKAVTAYECVLRLNDKNVHALLQLASISRVQERFADAVEYLGRILKIDGPSGEVHGAIGHCYLTLSQRADGVAAIGECLKNCYDAYREASQLLGASSDPNLWYGIGLLYERFGALMQAGATQRECYHAAEEALRSVLQAAPGFEKRAEILYRLGMIYKSQSQPQQALECFQAICESPPPPLSLADIWFLIGSVQESMEPPAPEYAKGAYEHVLRLMQLSNDTSKVARVYRQLGWVCHKWSLETSEPPLRLLQRAVELDACDAENWHLLGKCLAQHSEVDGAYDCLSHAVSMDPSASETWATVGSVYVARGQQGDAVTALEHAVHLNPLSAAWYELAVARHAAITAGSSTIGIADATKAYTKALATVPAKHDDIVARLQHLGALQAEGGTTAAPTGGPTPIQAAIASASAVAAAASAAAAPPSQNPMLGGGMPAGWGSPQGPQAAAAVVAAAAVPVAAAAIAAGSKGDEEGKAAAVALDVRDLLKDGDDMGVGGLGVGMQGTRAVMEVLNSTGTVS